MLSAIQYTDVSRDSNAIRNDISCGLDSMYVDTVNKEAVDCHQVQGHIYIRRFIHICDIQVSFRSIRGRYGMHFKMT